MINSLLELERELIHLFPKFKMEIDEEEYGYGNEPPITYHRVWLNFTPVAYSYLSQAENTKVKKFCDIVNYLVIEGDDRENAVSTCFFGACITSESKEAN